MEETKSTENAIIRRMRSPNVLIGILVAFLILIVSLSTFFFYQYQKTQAELRKLKENPRSLQEEENKRVVESVQKLIRVPTDEDPTIVTVFNPDQLKSQPFFANAKEGDKVLVYSKSKKAILYDPVSNIVIEVAPLVDSNESTPQIQPTAATSTSPTATPTATAPLKLLMLNGTERSGLSQIAERQIPSTIPFSVVAREYAESRAYPETIVVARTDAAKGAAPQIASALGGAVGQLPESEQITGDPDIVIIIGSTFSPTSTPEGE